MNGIDRVDNSCGYVTNNIEPCCRTCNFMKKDLNYDIFINKLIDIYHNNELFDESILPDIIEEHDANLEIDDGHDNNNNLFNDYNIEVDHILEI